MNSTNAYIYRFWCVRYVLFTVFPRDGRIVISNDWRLRQSWHGPDGKVQENDVLHILLSHGPEYIFLGLFIDVSCQQTKKRSDAVHWWNNDLRTGWFTSKVNKGSSTNEISPIDTLGSIENRRQVFLITCKSDFSSLNYRGKTRHPSSITLDNYSHVGRSPADRSCTHRSSRSYPAIMACCAGSV